MKEMSAFEIGLSLDSTGLLAGLVKIGKFVQEKLFSAPGNSKSIFPDLSELIARSGIANVPDVQTNQAARSTITTAFDWLTRIGFIATTMNGLLNSIEERRTDLERLNEFIGQVEDLSFQNSDEKNLTIDKLANSNLGNKDKLLSQQKILEERATLLTDFLIKLEEIRDGLVNGALRAGIPDAPQQTEFTPVLPIAVPAPTIIIDPPRLDFIAPLQDKLDEILKPGTEALRERSQIIPILDNATAMLNNTMSDAVNPLQAHKDALEASNNVSEDLTGNAEDLGDTFKDSKKQFDQAGKSINKFDGTAVDLGTSLEKTDEVAQQLGENGLPKIKEGAETAGEGVVKASEEGKRGLSSLGVFAGNIATNIAESFSDFISTAIKGDFDGIGDLWDNLLDSLQNSFADLVGGFLTNPIRIAFESTLKGEGGITDFFKDLFGGGGKKEESTTDKVTDVATEGTEAASQTVKTTEEAGGLIDSISGVVGTIGQVAGIIGAITGLVLSIVNIVSGLTKKKPQLDVDLDQIRDEFGESTGQAAKVLDFLDDEVANSIINISTKRKAGLGGLATREYKSKFVRRSRLRYKTCKTL